MLGAQDGIVSTASLLVGVAAASASRSVLLQAGLAGLVGGALSMATGEYSSVSSQRDTELADIARETRELARFPDHELEELIQIYEDRGLERPLARQVAGRLMEHDPLGSHIRDELGINERTMARPGQAAVVSAVSFASGAALALLVAALTPSSIRIAVIAAIAVVLLVVTGAAGARLGGASRVRGALRVAGFGALAMLVTGVIGRVVGTNV